MSTAMRRAVVVHRPTDLEMLIANHGTRGQAEFFLRSLSQSIQDAEREHTAIHEAIATVLATIPPRWRRANIAREDLSRFLFEPDDVVVAVGQDGLVANVAKYLSGQAVVGVNPLPDRFDGLLVRHPVSAVRSIFTEIEEGREPVRPNAHDGAGRARGWPANHGAERDLHRP
jgi:NAD kinase